jgi:hypothetical protein
MASNFFIPNATMKTESKVSAAINYHAINAYGGSEGMGAGIPSLGIPWRIVGGLHRLSQYWDEC